MAVLNRAIISLVRRPARSILLFLIILIIGYFEITGVSLNTEADNLKDITLNKIGAVITLSVKNISDEINSKTLNNIMRNPHVLGYNFSVNDLVNPVDFSNHVKPSKSVFAQISENQSQVRIEGDLNIKMVDAFREGHAKLIDGVFPTENNHGAIIDDYLAKQNDLHVEDKITVTYKGNSKDMSILGVYSSDIPFEENYTNRNGEVVYIDSPYSRVFTDFDTARDILNYENKLFSVDFYIDKINNLNHTYAEIKALKVINWDQYMLVNTTETNYSQVASSINAISSTSVIIIYSVLVAGMLILLLVILLWMKDYTYDAGVLLSLGENKKNITFQFLMSVLIITLISTTIAIIGEKLSLQYIGRGLLSQLEQSSANAITISVPDPKLDLKQSFSSEISYKAIIYFILIEILTVMIPAIVSCLSILRYKPSQILKRTD